MEEGKTYQVISEDSGSGYQRYILEKNSYAKYIQKHSHINGAGGRSPLYAVKGPALSSIPGVVDSHTEYSENSVSTDNVYSRTGASSRDVSVSDKIKSRGYRVVEKTGETVKGAAIEKVRSSTRNAIFGSGDSGDSGEQAISKTGQLPRDVRSVKYAATAPVKYTAKKAESIKRESAYIRQSVQNAGNSRRTHTSHQAQSQTYTVKGYGQANVEANRRAARQGRVVGAYGNSYADRQAKIQYKKSQRKSFKRLNKITTYTRSQKAVIVARRVAAQTAKRIRLTFSGAKIAAAALAAAGPVLIAAIICIAVVSTVLSLFSPADILSSRASNLFLEITEWESEEYKIGADGKKTYPYLTYSGVTVDVDELMTYAIAKYFDINKTNYDEVLDDVSGLYEDIVDSGMHDNVKGYIEAHKNTLFTDSEYADYKELSDSDEYVFFHCYGSPFVGTAWKEKVTSRFGHRIRPNYNTVQIHAVDIAMPKNTPINCIMECKVINVGYDEDGYGNYVKTEADVKGALLTHKIITIYGHLTEASVRKGDELKTGDEIGLVGSTGNSTGNHLHLEIRLDGEQINAYIVCSE